MKSVQWNLKYIWSIGFFFAVFLKQLEKYGTYIQNVFSKENSNTNNIVEREKNAGHNGSELEDVGI